MDSSRRRGIVQKLCIENIYQVTGHLVHGKLVPPYPPLHSHAPDCSTFFISLITYESLWQGLSISLSLFHWSIHPSVSLSMCNSVKWVRSKTRNVSTKCIKSMLRVLGYCIGLPAHSFSHWLVCSAVLGFLARPASLIRSLTRSFSSFPTCRTCTLASKLVGRSLQYT